MERQDQILFKKTSPKSLVIGDVNPFINIVSEYFFLEQNSIPMHSSRFIRALQSGELLIVNGTEGLSNSLIRNKLDLVATVVWEDRDRPSPPEKIKKVVKLPPVRSIFDLLGIARPGGTLDGASLDATKIIEEDELISGVNSFLLKK